MSDGRRSATGNFTFSRKRFSTLSTSMMASSTNAPMAMAMPPRLMVLMVKPSQRNARMDTSSASGIASSEMRVLRMFMRNTSSTMTTKMLPSNSER